MNDWINCFVIFFAVIDPVGTLPVFIAVTAGHAEWKKRRIAYLAVLIATAILLFFLVAGQFLLEAMGVPLSAFEVAGGIVLFLFALTMIFGDSKPEKEVEFVREGHETAVFPLAVPSIASPGAMIAAVVLTDNHRFNVIHQLKAASAMLAVLLIVLALILMAKWIYRFIGPAGASIVSRVMGLILASVATTNILLGIQQFFSI